MADASHILVVDDDDRLRDLLAAYLTDRGYYVVTANNAMRAQEILTRIQFDAMVLDVMMPGMTGLEWLRSVRTQNITVPPVLFLSAMSEVEQRIEGLEAGAQDYLPKPFEPRELDLRLRTILSRTQTSPKKISFGSFEFDLASAQLFENGMLIHLTTAEAQMLKTLASRAGAPVSRDDLAQQLNAANDRSIDVQINRLRKKIEGKGRPVFIQTVRGAGYMLQGRGA